jgi:hypothetical protein
MNRIYEFGHDLFCKPTCCYLHQKAHESLIW